MPQFKYKAVDRNGKVNDSFVVEAPTQADSVARLRQKGYTPIKFIGQVGGEGAENGGGGSLFQRKALDAWDFTNRLVPLLNAHVPIERALGIIEEGMENERSRSTVAEIRRGLHEGKRFSALIRERGNSFPGMYANMVEAGEESGALNNVMKELQKFLNEARDMKEFLITSSIYPCIILSVTSIVIILLFTFFIPKFAKIFADIGRRMPLPTQIMMDISYLLTHYWWAWLMLVAGMVILIAQIRRGGKLKEIYDQYVLKMPILGNLILYIEITRFVRTLAVLIQNHVHLLDTLRIAVKVIQNTEINRSLEGISGELRGGKKLSDALAKSGFIPKTVLRMLSIGEETGNMGDMLDKVAEQYEEQVRQQIKRLLAMFEPAIILVLAFVVMGVVLSVFMAILEMNKV